MRELTDSERLAVIETTVQRIEKLLSGNGRPGIVEMFWELHSQVQSMAKREEANRPASTTTWVNGIILAVAAIGSIWMVWFAAHPRQ